jgi:serine/threonine protein kinase
MVDKSELPTVAPGTQAADPSTIDLVPAAHVHDEPTLTPKTVQPGEQPAAPEDVADQPTLAPGTSSTPREAPLPAGDWTLEARPFGDYELLGEIARGGMGIVYRARERHSGRLLALKMMLGAESSDATERGRFILEARATGELSHPGIVAIHAWSEHEGHSFYTMDFVAGHPLNQILRRRRPSIDRAVCYLAGIARAVGAAHQQGIVHRDLKPSNIMIDSSDQPRVLDFGLAKRVRQEAVRVAEEDDVVDVLPAEAPLPQSSTSPTPPPVTAKGSVLGTPTYMAPEQARGEHSRVGPEADVHALGAILFEMLTGRPPYQATSVMDTLIQVMEQKPPDPWTLNPHIPRVLAELCLRCLQKDPAKRYTDANALADDLELRWSRHTQSRGLLKRALLSGVAGIGTLAALFGASDWLGLTADIPRERLAALLGGQEPMLTETALMLLTALGVLFTLIPTFCLVACVIWLATWCYTQMGSVWSSRQAAETPPEAEPYLQKLFVVRGEKVAKSAAASALRSVELEDVELGKDLLDSPLCRLHRGRQKSLDRPVLVWQVRGSLVPGAPAPGVVVHHPAVLTLHAVETCPEGRVLVTSSAAGQPLAEIISRRLLEPTEASAIICKSAQAIQAFHNQGVCHGRLAADWILLQGDHEPLLCPCGVPSQSSGDRAQDLVALGKLLRDWLPPRSRGWAGQSLAPLYLVSDAAVAGEYERAGELSRDIDRAGRLAVMRWRERMAQLAILAILVIPLFGFAFLPFLGTNELLIAEGASVVLLGFIQGRTVAHYARFHLKSCVRRRYLRQRLWAMLGWVGLATFLPALVGFALLRGSGHEVGIGTFMVAADEMAAFWFLGICATGLVLLLETLGRSLRQQPADRLTDLGGWGEPLDSSPSWRSGSEAPAPPTR